MKTSNDILVGLLAVKDLEIKTLRDRLVYFEEVLTEYLRIIDSLRANNESLLKENDQFYAAILKQSSKMKPAMPHDIGFTHPKDPKS